MIWDNRQDVNRFVKYRIEWLKNIFEVMKKTKTLPTHKNDLL